jgi:hypothetical protein
MNRRARPDARAEADVVPGDRLSISLSGRLDRHSVYGTFLSPRASVLLRPAEEWTVRASAGAGYFAPTPWTDETEAVGLSRVRRPLTLQAERGRTGSIDVSRTFGRLELNATAFAARISDPAQVRPASDGRLELFNAARPILTRGTELLARYHAEGLHVTATHVYIDATEQDPAGTGRREVPLTPRHTAGIVAAREQEGRGRYAVEFYYTGRQQLDDNPYRTRSEPHVIVGFLVERRFGPVRVFLNAENISDTRQTRHDPLLLPARSPVGRWTTDVWAPLEGRSFNGGIRWELRRLTGYEIPLSCGLFRRRARQTGACPRPRRPAPAGPRPAAPSHTRRHRRGPTASPPSTAAATPPPHPSTRSSSTTSRPSSPMPRGRSRRRSRPAVGRGRLPRLPPLRHPRPRLRPHPLRRVRRRAPRGLLLQGSRRLPLLQRPSHGGGGRPPADHVLPPLPVRQWVLSLPKRIRPFLPHDPPSPATCCASCSAPSAPRCVAPARPLRPTPSSAPSRSSIASAPPSILTSTSTSSSSTASFPKATTAASPSTRRRTSLPTTSSASSARCSAACSDSSSAAASSTSTP